MKREKDTFKADLLLLSALILVGGILALVLLLTRQEGGTVQVRVSGRVVQSFSLQDTVTYEITGANGGTNVLMIRDGQAWIEEADCPDGLCKNMGKIHRVGQSVVCLPHEVVVEIVGEAAETDGVDVLAG